MDKVTLTIRYWLFIILRSIQTSIVPKKFGGKAVEVAVEFFAAVILVWGLGLPGQVPSVDFNLRSGLLVLVMFAGFYSVLNILYLPAKLYDELGGFTENPFEITTLDTDFSNPEAQWATIKINNQSKVAKIENCYIELTGITDLTTNQVLNFDAQNLTWSGRETDIPAFSVKKPLTIYSDSPRWCDIARVIISENKANFLTWYAENTDHAEIKPGRYRLKIKAHGELQNHPVNHSYLIDLTYQADKDPRLTIGKIREIK